jgi:hypothetical protein
VETSWTPALTLGGASVGMTYGTQVGQYYAMGYLIFAMFNIVLTAVGSSTGAATISLPIAAGGTNRIGGGGLWNYSNLTSVTTFPWLNIAASGTTAALVQAGSATVAALTDANIASTTTLQGWMLYLSG